MLSTFALISALCQDRDPAWVDQRVKEWTIRDEERKFDQIGWVKEIREAERLAKEHGRLVFWFSHDGRMAIGRC